MFEGAFVAIVTPFKDGRIDEDKLRELIEFQIENGTHGIVPCGTTGESATLSYEEHKRVVRITVEQVKGRVPVVAGSGSNSTREALELTAFAKEAGADAALVITPYYNKPTQEGLYQHYKKIAEETKFPIIIYNVPGRTGCDILPETVARLASQFKEIVGIKEATGSVRRATEVLEKIDRDDFCLLSGDDFIVYPLICVGAKGVISVVSNIAPNDMSELVSSAMNGNYERAKDLHYRLQPLCRAMFIETNPIPVKTALAMMGRIEEELRLPLCRMKEENRKKLEEILKSYGLI
ncbi:MAG: 4-hydroxy-tetrahydrodipicolinate synthase [Deferribacteres bacterium]|nr:4-hydroxy-tetrahydrodipicolinate synthase [Deferribacteres bacterium]